MKRQPACPVNTRKATSGPNKELFWFYIYFTQKKENKIIKCNALHAPCGRLNAHCSLKDRVMEPDSVESLIILPFVVVVFEPRV